MLRSITLTEDTLTSGITRVSCSTIPKLQRSAGMHMLGAGCYFKQAHCVQDM
jgi:hypothetical protein